MVSQIPSAAELPAILTQTPNWVCWRREVRGEKETKVPYRVGGELASVTDPRTWSTFAAVRKAAAAGGYDGIGFVLTEELNLVGLDLDKCVSADGTIDDWAKEIICRFETYAETSPSGTGLRLWLRGELPPGRRRSGPFEIYSSGRYLTVTGNRLQGAPMTIADGGEALAQLHAQMFPEKEQPKSAKNSRVLPELDLDDEALLQKMFDAKNGDEVHALWDGDTSGYPSHSEADEALCSHLVFWADAPERVDRLFRISGLMREKWDRKTGDSTYGKITVRNACALTTERYEGSDAVALPPPSKGKDPLRVRLKVDTSRSVNQAKNGNYVDTGKVLISEDVDTEKEEEKCQLSTGIAVSESDWGAITPVSSTVMPEFPIEALPPVIGDYAKDVARAVQVPIDLAAMSALAVLSFAVSRRWQVQIRSSYIEPTNLYVATAMEPGSRKSSCLELMVRPLRKVERYLVDLDKERGEEREEQRKAAEARLINKRKDLANTADAAKILEINTEIARIKDNMPADIRPPRLIVEDVTTERLVGLLQDQNGSLALISSEGGIFGTIGGRYNDGQVNVDVYLKGHDAEEYRVDRLNRPPEHIDNVRLSMCLTVQPDVIHSLTKKSEFRGRGLLGRFLYAIPTDMRGRRLMKSSDGGVDPELLENYSQALRALLLKMPASSSDPYERYTVTLSKAALDVHMEFANRIETQQSEDGELRPLSDWASKLAGRVARIAAAFHCLQLGPETPEAETISEETILQAWALADYLVQHAIRAFDLMSESQQSRYAMRVLEWLKRKRLEQFTARTCYRDLQKSVPQKDCLEALKLLTLNNYIRVVENRNANNVRVVTYETNPAFLIRSAIPVDS